MVTVISRPIGHKLSKSLVSGNLVANGLYAQIVTADLLAHGLTTGDYVYVDSDFESYNGYKYVHVTSFNSFEISDTETGTLSAFKQEASIGYYVSELEHGYSCVHLPIVYEIHSNVFPNNELDESYSPRTVSSFSNSNGYTQLNLSLDLYNYQKLDFIILKGDGPLAGPYQIVNSVDANSPIINLAYKPTNDFSPYVVEQYYNNYFIGVDIYAGLSASHRWDAEKPMRLIATLKLIPDSDGNTKFSVAEILKSQITTRNNLTLDTLPNNIDFFTEFYISTFEGYDVSDGSTISKYESESLDDSFVGQAINAMLPFQSIDAGYLSDYINSSITFSQWLTNMARPTAVVGHYFDLSFINTTNNSDIIITILKRFEGYTSETELINIENPGRGVLRIPITAENGFDEYCIQASSIVNIHVDISTYSNRGFGTSWIITGSPAIAQVTLVGFATSKTLYGVFIFGESITVRLRIISTAAGQLTVKTMNSGFTDLNFYGPYNFVGGDHILEFVIPYDPSTIYLGFIINSLSGGSEVFSINEFTVSNGVASVLTEQICVDIVEECNTYVDGNARLIEDGNIRIIE